MALKSYSILKGNVSDYLEERDNNTPHFQVKVEANGESFRIAVNVMSSTEPSELKYIIVSNFQHALTDKLLEVSDGIHSLNSKPYGSALDYIRGNLFDITAMKRTPHNKPGPLNDLNDLFTMYTKRAKNQPGARIYAFGEKWESEHSTRDRYFDFTPDQGIHDIHMNQGNSGHWAHNNGIYQDGGIIFHFPEDDQWVGVFMAFQSQAIHTDDQTGDPIDAPMVSGAENLRIVAALVNPHGEDHDKETVTLMNISDQAVNLSGWYLSDKNKSTLKLPPMNLPPDETIKIHLSGNDIQLSNKGGQITLLTPEELKVHGVSYSKKQASREGWSILF